MSAPGLAHIQSTEVAQQSSTLTDTGQILTSAWQSRKGEISTNESGIGSGKLGAAFWTGYTAASETVRTAADRIPAQFQELGAAGTASAAGYENHDGRAAAGFPGGPP
jgi:hypothetical protein